MRASPRSAIPPPPRAAVARARLEAMLDVGAHGLLTLVAAPSGTGKTVLVSSWARTRSGAVRWISVDEATDATDLWHEILTVLDPTEVETGTPGRPCDLSGRALDRLATSLDAREDPVELVLDCEVALPPEVASALDRLLRRRGDLLHVVVIARVDPAMPLHRYRLEGTVTEIRAADLAFTRSEASEMLATAGLDLLPADVETLIVRTQGWAAGLRLASLAITPRTDRARAVHDVRGDTGMVAEYLLAEMLDQQPAEVRDVLLRTSVVDVVRPGLAQVLAGPRTPRTLAAMRHENILVEELTEHPGWYRYHPLFRELLQAQLAYEAPDEHRALHRAAAAWYVENDRVDDAVRHAAAVEDWTVAARLVVDSLSTVRLAVERTPTLGDLLADLPEHLTGAAPRMVRACLDLRDDCDPRTGAVPLISTDDAASWPEGRLTAALLTLLSASRLSTASTHPDPSLRDPGAVLGAAAVAEDLLTAQPAHRLESHPEVRTVVRAGAGTGWVLRGDLDRAAQVFAAGAHDPYEPGRELPVIRCLGHLSLVVALRSELRRSAALADETLARCRAAGARGGAEEGAAELALAWVRTETFELGAARRHLVRARTCHAENPGALVALVLPLVTARLSLAHGDPAGARDVLRDALECSPPLPEWMQALLCHEAGEVSVEATQAALGGPRPDEALPMLALRVEALLAEAADHLAAGETARARRLVARSLGLAAPESLRRPFRQAPREVRQLLRLDPALLTAHRWLVGDDPSTLAACAGATDATAGSGTSRTPAVLVPLTAKELEVLVHLDALARTEDIAGAMFITVNTVRTHIRHILQKLDATRRNEAVRRARELGLIAPLRSSVTIPDATVHVS
ncbi:LuxR C-terminal-related transcriptional regulator [Sanguibacter sp. 25GB23B1]|uniref:LuxR C-terminal-related transcriptional regulator n=1 Tax=unclassified Sanguibacter TaxID=2645534 RepID=UPI0032AF4E9A